VHSQKTILNFPIDKITKTYLYIIILIVAISTVPRIANAQCDRNLIGLWTIKYSSIELDKDKEVEKAPATWNFGNNGKANLKIYPFLDVTSDFACNKNSLIIKKTVPTTLNITRLTENELVWKEIGNNKYYYWVK